MPVHHEVEVIEEFRNRASLTASLAKENVFTVCISLYEVSFTNLTNLWAPMLTRTLFSGEEDYEIQMHFCRFTS